MKVSEVTKDRLTLVDTQLDKKLGIAAMSAFLLYMAYEFSVTGDYLIAAIPVAIVLAMLVYLWRTVMRSEITFDKPGNSVTLQVRSRRETQHWDWKLSDIKTTTVTAIQGASTEAHKRSTKRPVLVLNDGTMVPMRPYHSAGSQSWQAIEAIRKFIGDDNRDDFPTGYIFDVDDGGAS